MKIIILPWTEGPTHPLCAQGAYNPLKFRFSKSERDTNNNYDDQYFPSGDYVYHKIHSKSATWRAFQTWLFRHLCLANSIGRPNIIFFQTSNPILSGSKVGRWVNHNLFKVRDCKKSCFLFYFLVTGNVLWSPGDVSGPAETGQQEGTMWEGNVSRWSVPQGGVGGRIQHTSKKTSKMNIR